MAARLGLSTDDVQHPVPGGQLAWELARCLRRIPCLTPTGWSCSPHGPVPGGGGHALLWVQGPLVFGAGGLPRDAGAELVDASQPWLLLDLSWSTRLDRAGLVVLVFIRRRLRVAGGCLHLFDRCGNASRALPGSGLAGCCQHTARSLKPRPATPDAHGQDTL